VQHLKIKFLAAYVVIILSLQEYLLLNSALLGFAMSAHKYAILFLNFYPTDESSASESFNSFGKATAHSSLPKKCNQLRCHIAIDAQNYAMPICQS